MDVIFEHRSGAYIKYVSTGAQKIASRRPPERLLKQSLKATAPSALQQAAAETCQGNMVNGMIWLKRFLANENRIALPLPCQRPHPGGADPRRPHPRKLHPLGPRLRPGARRRHARPRKP